jgi:broad specificity phosphatase PhoE
MRELVLIRHGHSRYAGERYIGRTDTSLTEQGSEQAKAVCSQLECLPVDVFYCSPALRARETLRPILDKNPARKVVILPELQEIDFGKWEGLSFDEIQAQSAERVAEWASGRRDFVFPEGESLELFWQRVCQAGDRVLAGAEKRVAVVTHGGVIRCLLCHYLGLPPEKHRSFQIDLGSMTTLTFSEGFAVLKGLNAHG